LSKDERVMVEPFSGLLMRYAEERGACALLRGLRALDLFAGTASLAFEAVSRGAEEAWCVEAEKKLANRITDNARRLDLADGRVRVWPERVEKFLRRRVPAPFDLIFVDPPYGANLLPATLRAVLRGGWLKEGGMIAAEVETGLDVPEETSLLTLMDRSYGQTRIVLWTLRKDVSPSIPEPSTR
jgi:16S rRNA (guanine966-N2)-methyltransferase